MKKRGPLLSVKGKLQNQLVWIIFVAMSIPTVVLGGSLYILVARIAGPNADSSPHAALMQIAGYIGLSFPPLTALLLCWAFNRTNKIVGPIERVTRELDDRIAGTTSGPITLRPGDQIIPLVDRINMLLQERDDLKTTPPRSLGLRDSQNSVGVASQASP